MKILHWRFLPLVGFLGLVIFFWRGLSLDPNTLPSARLGQVLPSFQLPVLEPSSLQFNNALFHEPVQLLIVWASWCAACIDEQPFLMRLAKEGLPMYGLNYKDTPADAKRWLAEWGNPYRLVGEDKDGHVAIDLGVYGAPETFLIDKAGIIRYRQVGVLTEAIWEKAFLPRIKALQGVS